MLMKKLITLLILFVGMVSTVSATKNVTLYFYPNDNTNWTSASAAFRLELYVGSTLTETVDFEYNTTHLCYYYTYDSDTYDNFKILRVNPSDHSVQWNSTPSSPGVLPTQDSYLYLTNTAWDNASYNVSLVPWKYYFYGSWGAENAWCAGDALVESDGNYHGDLVDMNGKNFVIFEGSQINYYSNTIWDNNSWNNAWRPYQGHTINFETTNHYAFKGGGSDNAYINTEGTVSVTFTKSNDTQGDFQFAPSKTATIGAAGYLTYSNGEKYTVSGATAYTAKDMGTYAKLSAIDGGTVFPANTGLLLRGSGEVTINAVASDASTDTYTSNYASNNNLIGSGNSSASISEGCFVLYWDGSNPSSVCFRKAEAGTLAAHKAYLPAGALAREFLSFEEGETTGIETVKATQKMNGEFFNLAGQRVAQPAKGLYIVNGKKVIMK